jgi:hypothetical protein
LVSDLVQLENVSVDLKDLPTGEKIFEIEDGVLEKMEKNPLKITVF